VGSLIDLRGEAYRRLDKLIGEVVYYYKAEIPTFFASK
jgi:hypothetical protein